MIITHKDKKNRRGISSVHRQKLNVSKTGNRAEVSNREEPKENEIFVLTEGEQQKQIHFPQDSRKVWDSAAPSPSCTSVLSSQKSPPAFPIFLSSMCSQGYIPFPSLQKWEFIMFRIERLQMWGNQMQLGEKKVLN